MVSVQKPYDIVILTNVYDGIGPETSREWDCKYSWFPIFMVVTLYRVPTNRSEWTRTIAPGGRTAWESCEPWGMTFSSLGQLTTLLYVCFCLKTPCCFLNMEPVALSTVAHAQRKLSYPTCFFCKAGHIVAFLHSGTLDSAMAGDHCKWWNHQAEAQQWEKPGTE